MNKDDFEVVQIDAFTLMGRLGKWLENIYIPITTKFPIGYYVCFLLTQAFPDLMHFLIYLKINRKFRRKVEEENPDLIITVHSMFTKSISHFLKAHKMNIPFYIDVIDLVKPPRVWFDKNADITFVPTEEVKKDYIEKGMNKNRVLVSGFPIRNDIAKREKPKQIEKDINILLVNPSVRLKKNIKFLKEVSKIENSTVSVICGRDEAMYKALTNLQNNGEFSNNINIYGFVNNMNEFLDNAHIILTKAGPNMLLEAVKSSTVVIVTGHILGQENYNYQYIVENKYGLKCEKTNEIYKVLQSFIQSNKVNQYLKFVHNANLIDGAEFITNFIKNG